MRRMYGSGSVHVRGVSVASARARDLEKRITILTVTSPFVALGVAVWVMWNHGVSAVDVCLLIAMYSLNIVGIGVGYHRYFTHRAFDTTPAVKAVLAALGSIGAQGPLLYWTALHRRHHALSDKEGDPHSPHLHGVGIKSALLGFWHAHTGWLFVYEVHNWSIYVPDLIKDRLSFRLSRLYFVFLLAGLALPAVAGGLIVRSWYGAWTGLLWGGLVRIFLTHHMTWSVNSICHIAGSRPYRTTDRSRNNMWLALPSFGESWHNNHHAFPTSAYHGLRWWQVDLSAYLIGTLKVLGLAWNVKLPTVARMKSRAGED